MLIGTAGHIDHGKTTLLRALTGVETDRLPEEKRRGISIELGYAYLPLPGSSGADATLGFIDVPGHEKFVPTMLAGASGIDHALLVVAADDGPMPQTREHLQILDLLGVTGGTVAITKTDRVDATRIAQVRDDLAALLAASPLHGSPMFPVAAPRGDGVAPLREHLFAAARAAVMHDCGGAFRLAVDRAFTVAGAGTVVTGTVHAGRIAVGDLVTVAPGGTTARVRALHAQNQPVDVAHAGQRCALNLAGLPVEAVRRGDWVVARPFAGSTRIDVHLTLSVTAARSLPDGMPVQIHHGARHIAGRVALLDESLLKGGLAPGGDTLAQLVCDAPLAAWRDDLVVLRQADGRATLGGARVLDVHAPIRHRRTPERRAQLAAQALPNPERRTAALLTAAPTGLALDAWAANENLPLDTLAARAATSARVDAAAGWAIGHAAFAALTQALQARLADYHTACPDELGIERNRLRRMLAPAVPERAFTGWLAHWLDTGVLARSGNVWHLPTHCVELSEADRIRAERLLPQLLDGAFDPPWVRDLAAASGDSELLTRDLLKRLAARGEVYQVVRDLFYAPATIRALAAIARELGAAGPIRAAGFRDRTGLGRKRAIQVLEFFDRVGFTRRIGQGTTQAHVVRGDAPVALDETP